MIRLIPERDLDTITAELCKERPRVRGATTRAARKGGHKESHDEIAPIVLCGPGQSPNPVGTAPTRGDGVCVNGPGGGEN